MSIDAETETPNEYTQLLKVRQHTLRTDVLEKDGGHDTGPDAHEYFDASLIACKTLTAMWYAKRNKYPLERVEAHVDRDASQERAGKYILKVRVAFHGAELTDEQKQKLYTAVGHCPVHKLMTTTDVIIETAPLENG